MATEKKKKSGASSEGARTRAAGKMATARRE